MDDAQAVEMSQKRQRGRSPKEIDVWTTLRLLKRHGSVNLEEIKEKLTFGRRSGRCSVKEASIRKKLKKN